MKSPYANLKIADVPLDMPIMKVQTSCRLPFFLPTDGRKAVRATAASAIASAEASSGKKEALVFNTALVLIVLQDGVANLKAHTSCRLPSFLPMDGRNAVRATAASAIASAEASSGKKKALISTLHWYL
jgi:hypothetical protein